MATPLIQPRILKGFRDYLPEVTLARQKMIHVIEAAFSTFGFMPIDTPALEYAEILLGKGSAETDKQMYRFKDGGDRDVALRFDLTIPLARFAAMYANELGTPFKRYHIAPVWRAEKPQRGRYREFIQCDFDIIGTNSLVADAEIISIINFTLRQLKIKHRIRLNNRAILNGLLEKLGNKEKSGAVLRAIDKLEKLGKEVVTAELKEEAGLSTAQSEEVFALLALSAEAKSNESLIAELQTFFKGSEAGTAGVKQLAEIFGYLAALGVEDSQLKLDLSIARGLDYYTGTVFETLLVDLPDIGSICSGGRYDDLASLYTKQRLPGVGGSIGLDRLLAALEELNILEMQKSTAKVFVPLLDDSVRKKVLAIVADLRQAGIAVELSPDATKLGNQLKYADKKGIPFAVIAGEQELAKNCVSIKNLTEHQQIENVSIGELAAKLRSLGV